MSIKVMTWVWAHSPAQGTDRLILLAIADSADDDGGNAWPSEATLADKAKVSERTVRRSIRSLEEMGVLTVEPHAGGLPETRPDRRPNRYKVHMTTGQIDRADTEREDTGGQNGRTSATERADTRVRLTVLDPSKDPSMFAIERARQQFPQLDIDFEVGQFRNHHIAKGSKMANWDRALWTWLGNAVKWSKPGGSRPAVSDDTLAAGDRWLGAGA